MRNLPGPTPGSKVGMCAIILVIAKSFIVIIDPRSVWSLSFVFLEGIVNDSSHLPEVVRVEP